jgi:DNA-directed RNA polymerase sigma subunit (sigma70/sigma32)
MSIESMVILFRVLGFVTSQWVGNAMESLAKGQRDADIFDRRTMAENPKAHQELGDEYHISRERVRQVEKKIIENFKDRLAKALSNSEEEHADTAK